MRPRLIVISLFPLSIPSYPICVTWHVSIFMHGFCCKRKKQRYIFILSVSMQFQFKSILKSWQKQLCAWCISRVNKFWGCHQSGAYVTSVSNQRPAPHTTPIKRLWGWYDVIGFAVKQFVTQYFFLPRITKRGLWSIILWNTQNLSLSTENKGISNSLIGIWRKLILFVSHVM